MNGLGTRLGEGSKREGAGGEREVERESRTAIWEEGRIGGGGKRGQDGWLQFHVAQE